MQRLQMLQSCINLHFTVKHFTQTLQRLFVAVAKEKTPLTVWL